MVVSPVCFIYIFSFFSFIFRSEAAKVPSEEINIKDGEKKKEHGDEPNPASASLSTQPAALTQ